MRWKPFFTPVRLIPAAEAKSFTAERPAEEYNLIDVRQPREYEAGHIPGSRLIPIAELDRRLDEIDSSKPTLVY